MAVMRVAFGWPASPRVGIVLTRTNPQGGNMKRSQRPAALCEVLNEQCPTCIFRPGNLMSLQPGRVASMVVECRRAQSFITCHETMTYTDDEGEHATGPICRGFYDAHGYVSQLVRIAERMGMLTFVDQADVEVDE